MNSIRVHVHYGVTNDDDDALNKKMILCIAPIIIVRVVDRSVVLGGNPRAPHYWSVSPCFAVLCWLTSLLGPRAQSTLYSRHGAVMLLL
jgi:hypothetical protein